MADGNFDNVFASGRVDATQDVLAGASVRAGTFARVAQDLEVTGPTSLLGWVAVGHSGPRLALDVTGNALLSGSLRADGGLISAGFVGILTATPAHPLHVHGVAQVTDLRATEGVSVAHTDRPSHALDVRGNVLLRPSLNGAAAGNLYLLGGGRIGIGTSSPSQSLDVEGNVLVRPSSTPGTGNMYVLGRIGIGTTSPTQPLHVQGSALITGSLDVGTTVTSQHLQLSGNAQVRNLITTEWVGIAQASPRQALDVKGNVLIGPSSTGGDGNVYIESPGRVGIGTTSPSQPLHVQGSALVTGNLDVGTTLVAQHLQLSGNAHVSNLTTGQWVGIARTNPRQALDVTGHALISGSMGLGFGATDSLRQKLDVRGNVIVSPSSTGGDGNLFVEAGRVGIGTALPDQPLDVRGTAVVSGQLGIGTRAPIQPLDVRGTAVVSGRLGVGTTAPTEPLDVTGNARIRQRLQVGENVLSNVALEVAGEVSIKHTLAVGGAFPRRVGRALDVDGSARVSQTMEIAGNVGIGQSPGGGTGDERVRVTGSVRVSEAVRIGVETVDPAPKLHVVGASKLEGTALVTNTLTAAAFGTTGGHGAISNAGHIEATGLAIRLVGTTGTGRVTAPTVEATQQVTAPVVQAAQQIKVLERVIADSQGCRYA